MWYDVEAIDRPSLVETELSQRYIYVRRNIEEHERENEQGEKETYYTFEEVKIPREMWFIYEKELENSERLADVEEVITEILGGDIV